MGAPARIENPLIILDRLAACIVFAKKEDTHKSLSQLFENRSTEKIYYGLVFGSVSPSQGTIEEPIMLHPSGTGKMILHAKGKPSVTEYEVLEDFKRFSWVKFKILTGRTHQIRVHFSSIQHPIVADQLYAPSRPKILGFDRLALHALSLTITHPSGKEMTFSSALPEEFVTAEAELRQ